VGCDESHRCIVDCDKGRKSIVGCDESRRCIVECEENHTSKLFEGQIESPFEMYITSKQLKEDIGIALLDTGAQVSLVREKVLRDKRDIREKISSVQGIAGKFLETKGAKMLEVNESKALPFLIVDKLPRNLDCSLGQDWLKENNYVLATQQLLEPFSEKICKFHTKEKGVRLVEKQII